MRDYYALLGIKPDATKSDIKKNYRKLVTKFHPDKNPAPDAASKFIVITEAYEVLSDKKTRAQYDLMRWETKKRKQETEEDFTIVKAPQESLRTRRRKAQQKRGSEFVQAGSETQKGFRLIKEGFIVSLRYLVHMIGFFLILLITYSATMQISEAFEISIFVGLGIYVFIAALLYWTFRLLQDAYDNVKLDIETFGILFGIHGRTASTYTMSALVLILLIMGIVFKMLG